MYSVIILATLATGTAAPQSACYGCAGALNCGGGYGYDVGCLGCLGWGSGYGAYGYGGAFGCAGGAYACMGCYGGYQSWWSGAGGYGGYDAHVAAPEHVSQLMAPIVNPEEHAAPAKVVVKMPPNTRLYVEGKPVRLDPKTGSFTTRPLPAGANYVYTLKAEVVRDGQVRTESRDVQVAAGTVAQVQFGEVSNVLPVAARKETGTSARITVRLPEEARLFIDGVECSLTSDTRTFDTPALEAGREYTYTLRAELRRDGQTVTDHRVVVFRAGEPVTVDFGNLNERVARR
jgi:uncharacterized protein (TIGR03000 family)